MRQAAGDEGGGREAADGFALLTLDAEHSQYVRQGAITRNPETLEDLTIGRRVMVFDRDGWATLHEIDLVRREHGDHVIGFGPRIAWGDGSIAARKAAVPSDRPTAARHGEGLGDG